MGIFSKGNKATQVIINERVLTCPVCGGDQFWQRETQLNTVGMSFMNLDWANKSALNYVCDDCGYMFWFHPH